MPGGLAVSYGASNLKDAGGAGGGGSKGTSITANASANTKATSFTALVASTSYDAFGFIVNLESPNQASAGYLVDIAVGAAASEVVIVPNITFGIQAAANTGQLSIYCPVSIPAGSRVSARCQCSTGSGTITVSVMLMDSAIACPQSLGVPTNYGALTATSIGTLVDPGGVANTKNATYTELSSAVTYDIGALQLIIDNQNVATATTQYWLIDIGVGAAASEKVIIPNIMAATLTNGALQCTTPLLFPVKISAGSRLAITAQCSNTTAGTRKFGATVLGYQQ